MEITEPTLCIFYVNKFLALAPFSVRRNSKGALDIRRSVMFSVYSGSLCLIMVILTYQGLLFDANSQVPVRMKSATSKVVTALDVSVVVLACSAGVGCGLLGYRATRELNTRLRKIDDSMHSYSNFKRDRTMAILMMVLPLTAITSILGLDLSTWLRFAIGVRTPQDDTELNVQWYIPFYSLYFILTGLQINFANTAFGLGRRFRRLNVMLRNSFLKDNNQKDAPMKPPITTVKVVSQHPLALHQSLAKLTNDTLQGSGKQKVNLLRLLEENHESLGKCMRLVSNSHGFAVLFILVSCLLHLVATSYFLFLELLSKKDSGMVWLQVLWIIFHALRLILVVEPCHLATVESKKTIQIVCEIERKIHDPILAEEVKKFWQQLLVVDVEFSASGLCRVNRTLLTSFSSAICTYLVILIQFQNTNG
ncbi:gustatory receptor for sugar taste 43a isoform X2 [Ceratitis capitata]|uniref:gustatory receptor for sugar taste 43a isoform X2 n=1 Tax=Ceratitis capitata TaxID=7213 RepID=UPI00032A3A51|nr:gustatory receptor for sugar taste 43a isoform X2 [Ceratitis capitata]